MQAGCRLAGRFRLAVRQVRYLLESLGLPLSRRSLPPLNNHLHQIREWAPIVEGIKGWVREKGEAPETRCQRSLLLSIPLLVFAQVAKPIALLRSA